MLAIVARPLVFASVNPEVAEAKGVPVRVLGVVFMVALALVITMAVQVVGTLLLFGLVVTPAAAALAISARPAMVAVLSTAIGVVSRAGRAAAGGHVQPAAELRDRDAVVPDLAGVDRGLPRAPPRRRADPAISSIGSPTELVEVADPA